jgi:hypothetical protein
MESYQQLTPWDFPRRSIWEVLSALALPIVDRSCLSAAAGRRFGLVRSIVNARLEEMMVAKAVSQREPGGNNPPPNRRRLHAVAFILGRLMKHLLGLRTRLGKPLFLPFQNEFRYLRSCWH